jgi:hypothetical protein
MQSLMHADMMCALSVCQLLSHTVCFSSVNLGIQVIDVGVRTKCVRSILLDNQLASHSVIQFI